MSAILATEPIAETLSRNIVSEVDGWKLGDPRDPSVTIGPVISPRAAAGINDLVTDAVSKGAQLLRGGKFQGTYFGPVISIIRCKDEQEALNFARQSNFGLESCVFTRDFSRMWRVARALECGEVTINDYPSHGVGYFPFGGIKQSGLGRECIG